MTFVSLACAAALLASGDEVVAKIDGTEITAASFARRLEAARGGGGNPSPEAVLNAIADEILLASEGQRLGLRGSPEFRARLDAEIRHAAALAFERDLVARAAPDDVRLRSMFHATADFVKFESMTFETMDAARTALERIKAGSPWTAEAKKAVVVKLYPRPADAPLVMRAQLEPSLAEALFTVSPGATVGPVKVQTGAMLARVLAAQVGTDADFAEHRSSLLSHAKKQLATELRRQLVEHVQAKAGVKVDEAFLRSVTGTAATREQLEHVIATVNDRPIRYRDIYENVRRFGTGHLGGPAMKVQIAWQEVQSVILQDLAVDRGFDKRPEVEAVRPEIERAALATAAIDRVGSATPAPGEDEIQAFYKRNAERYRRPFSEVLPEAAADALRAKQAAAVAARVSELRKRASISIDRRALSRAASQGA